MIIIRALAEWLAVCTAACLAMLALGGYLPSHHPYAFPACTVPVASAGQYITVNRATGAAQWGIQPGQGYVMECISGHWTGNVS
jgi:hypothetical protein